MMPFKLPSFATIKLLLGGMAVLALAVMLLAAKSDARHWKKRFIAEEQARALDHAEWRRATYEATYTHVLNAERARLARAAIDERTIDALDHDRRSAAARFRMLDAQAKAHLGAPGAGDLSAEREATCRAVAGTSCDKIPSLLKAAQDNTDQLLRWIEWGQAQGAVPTVAPVPKNLLPDEGPAP